jgi:hypothetical protein
MGKVVGSAFSRCSRNPALSEMLRASNAKRTKGGSYPSVHVVVIAVMLLCICGLGLYLGTKSGHGSLKGKFVQRAYSTTNTYVAEVDNKDSVSALATLSALKIVGQKSPYAYVTLISGLDKNFAYRGYLYNALIMKRALETLGSTADFIALIGYSDSDPAPYQSDIELLRSHSILIYTLPRLLDPKHKLGFAEMALLKITPYSFTQYKRIQFLDGDVMPTRNMDCFFDIDKNSFTVGAVSPLNSGWYLAVPDKQAYEYMKERAVWRLKRDWDEINGWGEKMPDKLYFRGGKPCTKWLFNGADMDQGLFTHYFIINHGNAILVDTELRKARVFEQGLAHAADVEEPMSVALHSCNGLIPTAHFAHFTGRSKPWLNPDLPRVAATGKGSDALLAWSKHLDSLNLPLNSSTIVALNMKPSLGYFNANFPKGGFNR